MVDTSRVSVESAPQAENSGYDRREAEQAWLSAGRSSDVMRMKALLVAYPQWLALDRIVDDGDAAAQGPHSPQSRISDWRSFGLDTVGASALHAATWEGNAQIVRFLLDEGLDPDTRDDWQMTPLMVVIMRHTLPMIRSVFRGRVAIPRNLAVDCRQEDAERMQSTLPLLELFLAAGSDLEATNSDGKTALMLAANDDSFEIARLLLECTIEIDAQDHKGFSALRHSIEARSLLAMNLLLEHRADIDLPDLNGETPLSVVISRGLVNQLQLMLNHHASVSTASRHNFAGAVLMESVEQDAIDVMQFLLENEYVSVEYQNDGGESALHRVQNVQTLELFTRFDVNWTAFRLRTNTGDSCLHCAARLGSHQVLMAFLDQHERMRSDLADLFTDNLLVATNSVGATALFQAATNASEELEVRNAKSDLLLTFNASLFPVDGILWRAHDRDPSVQFFATPVRTCLRLWLQESDNGEAVSDLMSLTAEWICCACFSASHSQLLSSQLIGLVAFTEFACDVVPLLVELPLDRSSVSRFLLALEAFAERQDHRLLRHLHMLLAN